MIGLASICFLIFCAQCDAIVDKIVARNLLRDGFKNEHSVTYATSSTYFTDTADKNDLKMKLERTRDLLLKLQEYHPELTTATNRHKDFESHLTEWLRDVLSRLEKIKYGGDNEYPQMAEEWKNQFNSWYATDLKVVLKDLKEIQMTSSSYKAPIQTSLIIMLPFFVLNIL